ncbi:hypothetical protein V493_05562 [Pseudogymnoascus sp. VKM F-4281 (FW-2241)]|nr:hypothetical protein V493_05562 [Pseudogymnoascus sp. VKM F-4281 (FW-2241)]
MEPSLKRRRISGTQEQQRHTSGYDRHSRLSDPATLRQPLNSNIGAVYNDNECSSGLYGADNAREGSANSEDDRYDDDDEVSGEEYYEEDGPEADLQATRQKLDNKLKSTFEAIFEKYGKDFSGVGDEIDLRTGEIIVDNGHVAEMHTETDAGEVRGRGMLRAFTEEPEQARVPQGGVEDFDDSDDLHEDTDTDYHVRGRQMLRAFTQEPELGGEAGTEEEENEYDGDTSKLNVIDEDESDDDDILYQNSGVIPAKSMPPPPRPPLHKPQQRPPSRFHKPKPVPNPRLPSFGAAYPSEPDILAQFGQELGPRITEYVSRQTSVDEGNIDPKWRTPALPAATAGKRPILRSIILEPDTERSASPNANSLWAPETKQRRRRRKVGKKDSGPSGGSEAVVPDGTVVSNGRITGSKVPEETANQPESAEVVTPQNPPEQHSVPQSEGQETANQPESAEIVTPQNPPEQHSVPQSEGQDSDGDPFGDNVPGEGISAKDAVVEIFHDPELAEAKRQRRLKRPGKSKTWVMRNTYTEEEDKLMLEWAKWVHNESDYSLWSAHHWNLLSKKIPRHSGTAYRQRYRNLYNRNGGQHPFLEPETPAGGSSVVGTAEPEEAAEHSTGDVAARLQPFKEILHDLHVVKLYNLKKVSRLMKIRYKFTETVGHYRKQFEEWGFKKTGSWWETPEYEGMTRVEATSQRQKREKKDNIRLAKMAENGVLLPTLDPDKNEQIKAPNKERRSTRMRTRQMKDELSNIDHDEMEERNDVNEQRISPAAAQLNTMGGVENGNDSHSDKEVCRSGGDVEENTTNTEAREDRGDDDDDGLSEKGDSYDLTKLLRGASDYISPNSEMAMEDDQAVELPENKSEHNHDTDTNYTGRSLRSRVIPNSQSSQDLLSPCTSQANQGQVTSPIAPIAPMVPMAALNRDDVDPSYMFSDEEDEAVPVVPQTHTSNGQTFSAIADPPKPQPPSESAPMITPLAQEPDIPPQSPAMTLPSNQPDVVTASVEIKDESETTSRGLSDVYALPRSPPRIPTARTPVSSDGAVRIVITQPAISSPLTSPATRTPTPPNNVIASSVSKATPKRSPAQESTPRRSQTSVVRLSSTPTPRRNQMERSTSRPPLASRSATRPVRRSRLSLTPISRLAVRSPLRHDVEDEDENDGEIYHPSSQGPRAVGGGVSIPSTRKVYGTGTSATGTPSRRSRAGGGHEDGDLIQTPGGAWRRCGESGYKCGRGFCFQCSADGEGEAGGEGAERGVHIAVTALWKWILFASGESKHFLLSVSTHVGFVPSRADDAGAEDGDDVGEVGYQFRADDSTVEDLEMIQGMTSVR